MTININELVYAHTHNHPDAADYPTLADIRRGLCTGILAIPSSHLLATGVRPEDYQTWDDFVDAYLCHEKS